MMDNENYIHSTTDIAAESEEMLQHPCRQPNWELISHPDLAISQSDSSIDSLSDSKTCLINRSITNNTQDTYKSRKTNTSITKNSSLGLTINDKKGRDKKQFYQLAYLSKHESSGYGAIDHKSNGDVVKSIAFEKKDGEKIGLDGHDKRNGLSPESIEKNCSTNSCDKELRFHRHSDNCYTCDKNSPNKSSILWNSKVTENGKVHCRFIYMRVYRNILALAFSFMFLYSGFISLKSLESTMHPTWGGIGVTSLSCIYASSVITCLMGPNLIKQFGHKYVLITSMLLFLVYISCNLLPQKHLYVMLPASIILGCAKGMLWITVSSSITIHALYYARIKSASDVNSALRKFNGIFFAIYSSAQIWSHVISVIVLTSFTILEDTQSVTANSTNRENVRKSNDGVHSINMLGPKNVSISSNVQHGNRIERDLLLGSTKAAHNNASIPLISDFLSHNLNDRYNTNTPLSSPAGHLLKLIQSPSLARLKNKENYEHAQQKTVGLHNTQVFYPYKNGLDQSIQLTQHGKLSFHRSDKSCGVQFNSLQSTSNMNILASNINPHLQENSLKDKHIGAESDNIHSDPGGYNRAKSVIHATNRNGFFNKTDPLITGNSITVTEENAHSLRSAIDFRTWLVLCSIYALLVLLSVIILAACLTDKVVKDYEHSERGMGLGNSASKLDDNFALKTTPISREFPCANKSMISRSDIIRKAKSSNKIEKKVKVTQYKNVKCTVKSSISLDGIARTNLPSYTLDEYSHCASTNYRKHPISQCEIYLNDKTNDKLSGSTLSGTMSVLKDPRLQLLLPLIFFTALKESFVFSDYTKYYVHCAIGVRGIGTTMICYGVVCTLGSLFLGLVVKHIKGYVVMSAAALFEAGNLMVLLWWRPHHEDLEIFYVIASSMGLCDAIWKNQINVLMGILFHEKIEQAFALHRIVFYTGLSFAFACSHFLHITTKIYMMAVFLLIGLGLYAVLQIKAASKLQVFKPVVLRLVPMT